MTDLRTAAQAALDAMQRIYIAPDHTEYIEVWWPKCLSAIDTLRAALAQPEPTAEPVAWGVFDGPNLHDTFFTEEDAQYMVKLKGDGSVVQPLYTISPQRGPLSEDEAWRLVEQNNRMEEYADAAMELIRKTERAHGIGE